MMRLLNALEEALAHPGPSLDLLVAAAVRERCRPSEEPAGPPPMIITSASIFFTRKGLTMLRPPFADGSPACCTVP